VAARGSAATVTGREDVDTDVFFASSGALALRTEDRTRETVGLTAGKYGRVATTQTALVAEIVVGSRLTSVRPLSASERTEASHF
jgi:hypothetical protein